MYLRSYARYVLVELLHCLGTAERFQEHHRRGVGLSRGPLRYERFSSARVRWDLLGEQCSRRVVQRFPAGCDGRRDRGHTYPALTAVRTLQQRLAVSGRSLETLWIGTESGLEARVAPAEGIPFAAVATGKIRRSVNPLKMLSAANMKDMARVPLGVAQARKIIADFRPDVVLATGGYVAVPAGVAARLCRRPLVLHEQTVRLGLANRQLAGAATAIAVSSESTLELLPEDTRKIAVVTGNPVRPQVLSGHGAKAVEALGLRGFDSRRPTVYVT